MRDLTEEELALAPWATHYKVDDCDDVLFESEDYCQWLIDGVLKVKLDNFDISSDAIKITRKPFDITKHEWSDITMAGYEAAKCANGSIILNGSSKTKVINKQDGIAIANALGLTAGDLK
jgi:hypothetical protein